MNTTPIRDIIQMLVYGMLARLCSALSLTSIGFGMIYFYDPPDSIGWIDPLPVTVLSIGIGMLCLRTYIWLLETGKYRPT